MPSDPPNRGPIDTTVLVHLAALTPAQLPEEMVISAVTLAELSPVPTTRTTRPSAAIYDLSAR